MDTGSTCRAGRRWETEEADFFVSLPTGGDYYVLKRIIHDKNEDECRRILRTCRAAMSDGAACYGRRGRATEHPTHRSSWRNVLI